MRLKHWTQLRPRCVRVVWLAVLLVSMGVAPSFAEREHDRGHYRAEHWELDMRHAHDRYYPARSYIVPALPPGALHFPFGGHHFYFRSGVWFQANGPNYIIVSPPPGIVIPVLPSGYSTLSVGGMPYYYANNTYYAPADGPPGYMVVAPPPGYEAGFTPPPLPAPAAPLLPPASPASIGDGLFVYPRDNQSPQQAKEDRQDCDRWATDETTYDPNRGNSSETRRADFQRAVSACLEG